MGTPAQAAPQHPAMTLSRMGAQGAMLFAGMGLSQGLSFARNALLGHALSPRDFGIAASITLLLQLVETLSDLGHDRLIVQASDGDSDRFLAATHAVAVMRGVLLATILYVTGPWAAHFFGVAEAASAFQIVALVPLIKGLVHLDCRRAQRRFDNRPQLLVEVLPQAVALAATPAVLAVSPGYEAVVALAIIQASSSILTALALTNTPYRLAFDTDVMRRLISFGWPILLSALPLAAVYQGDRAIIGRISGIEALAAYSAAFMLAMVPGLLAARAGHALMLPMFSATLRSGRPLAPRFAVMTEATVILAALYLSVFVIAGGKLLPLAFGKAYAGHDTLLSVLAAMWALRMIQAVPGMALMAAGQTKPFLVAGTIRAAALPVALWAALHGASLPVIAAAGCAGEVASLLYVAARLEKLEAGLAKGILLRSLYLMPAGLAAYLIASISGTLMWTAMLAVLAAFGILGCGVAVMPGVLARVRRLLMHATASRRLKPT